MKYSFDDIRPMKINGGKVRRAEPVPSPVKNASGEIKPKEVEPLRQPKTRVKIADSEVPWLSEPPHKVKGSDTPTRPELPHTVGSSHKKKAFLLWLITIIAFAAFVLFLGNVFRRATVTLTPRMVKGEIDTIITATQSGTFPETIPFETMSLTETLEKNILATEAATVNEKARGTIILYNKAGSTSQNLVSGTRLSTPDGKIYTLERSVVIPGQKKVNGAVVPGQVEATIVASEPGEAYNGDPTDFSIVAYKGTSKYTTIYARSKGPREGGAIGTGFRLSNEELEKAKTELTNELTEKLISNAEKQVPEGYVFFRDASRVAVVVTPPPSYSPRASVTLSATGTLTTVLLPKDAFAYSVAKALTEDVTPKTKLEQPERSALSVRLSDESATVLANTQTVSLKLSGTTSIRWAVTTDVVREHLVNIEKNKLSEIVAKEPGVGSASVSLMPWYVKHLPEKTSRIRIVVE